MSDVLHHEDKWSVQRDLDMFPKSLPSRGGRESLGSFLVHGDHGLLDDPTDGQWEVRIQHTIQLGPCIVG